MEILDLVISRSLGLSHVDVGRIRTKVQLHVRGVNFATNSAELLPDCVRVVDAIVGKELIKEEGKRRRRWCRFGADLEFNRMTKRVQPITSITRSTYLDLLCTTCNFEQEA